MRQLTFRVWNGREMVYDVTVGKFGAFYVNPMSKGNGLDENDSASLTPFNTRYHNDTPVMQSTGLHDKNGKEIYESDVVRFFDGKIISTENGMDVDEIYNIGAFEWDETRMGWYVTNRDSVEMEEISEDIEVIGNLYENPELLSTPSLT
jgi:uncharacterized phage protein (TIGR01671 family)